MAIGDLNGDELPDFALGFQTGGGFSGYQQVENLHAKAEKAMTGYYALIKKKHNQLAHESYATYRNFLRLVRGKIDRIKDAILTGLPEDVKIIRTPARAPNAEVLCCRMAAIGTSGTSSARASVTCSWKLTPKSAAPPATACSA